MVPLAAALSKLSAGRREEALELLLQAWRTTRAPVIADVIDLVSEDLSRALPPIEGKTRNQFQEAWLDVANDEQARDVGRLLATFAREPCTQIGERLIRLEAREADPRVARSLTELVVRSPCTSTPNFPMWTRVFKILGALKDVRTREALATKLATKPLGLGSFAQMLYPRIQKLLDALGDPPSLSEDEERLVAALLEKARAQLEGPIVPVSPARQRTGSEEELCALVYEEPDSDGPRMVYADWLLERGDPRGELISLQIKARDQELTRSEQQRLRSLVREHARRCAGPLEPAIPAKSPIVLDRGFVSSCEVSFRTNKSLTTLLGHPAWRTVRELGGRPPLALVTDPRLTSLRAVRGLLESEAADLAELPRELPFVSLGYVQSDVEDRSARIASGNALSRVNHVALVLPTIEGRAPPRVGPEDLRELLKKGGKVTRLGARLERLEISGFAAFSMFEQPRPDLGAFLALAEDLPLLKTMSFDLQIRFRVSVSREGAGAPWALVVDTKEHRFVGTLTNLLQNVRPKTFKSYEVRPKSSRGLDEILTPYVV